jgi:hypothetical protein
MEFIGVAIWILLIVFFPWVFGPLCVIGTLYYIFKK